MASITCPLCKTTSRDDTHAVSCYGPRSTIRDFALMGHVWLCPGCGAINVELDNERIERDMRSGYLVHQIGGWFFPEGRYEPESVLGHQLIQQLGRALSTAERVLSYCARILLGLDSPRVQYYKRRVAEETTKAQAASDRLLGAIRLLGWARDELLTWSELGRGSRDLDYEKTMSRISEVAGETDLWFSRKESDDTGR